MASIHIKHLNSPDERRPFIGHGEARVYKLGDGTVGLGTFEPGWRWSVDVKPIAGTPTCESSHAMYVSSGRMHIRMNSGEEVDIGPGDFVVIPPGHDAWVIGDERFVAIDWAGMEHYAERHAQPTQGERPGLGAIH